MRQLVEVGKLKGHVREVRPVLGDHERLVGTQVLQQVTQHALGKRRLPQLNAHQGVAAASHTRLGVRHPLQLVGLLACQHVLAPLLHLLLYAAAANSAQPGSIGEKRHARARAPWHGTACGKDACEGKGPALLGLP